MTFCIKALLITLFVVFSGALVLFIIAGLAKLYEKLFEKPFDLKDESTWPDTPTKDFDRH